MTDPASRIRPFLLMLLITFGASALEGQEVCFRQGQNTISLRGRTQYVYFYPATGAPVTESPAILFAPGDGGWRGFAVVLAQRLASWGNDVYGLDTRQYLESFTGKVALTETDVTGDFRQLADRVAPGKRRVTLLGWSEGAGLVVLAACAPDRMQKYAGLLTLGLGDRNLLGWSWRDDLAVLTRTEPREPAFSALSRMGGIAPLPLAMFQSVQDEFVTLDESRRLFEGAREPKNLIVIDARDHRFAGKQDELFARLKEMLQWLATARP
jgi:alpha-beta hydrolase superfamily lysophospholipase